MAKIMSLVSYFDDLVVIRCYQGGVNGYKSPYIAMPDVRKNGASPSGAVSEP